MRTQTSGNYQRLKNAFGRRVEGPLMDQLTAVGERHGQDWLIYNPLRMRMFHRYARRDAAGVIGAVETVLPECRSYADVGAGSGAFASEAQRRGHPTIACERSRVGRLMARRQGVECRSFDLLASRPVEDQIRADLAYSFEVAEHLAPELGDRLVEFITTLAPTVVFTAAHPGQGGAGHINERPREYWQERFLANGFRVCDEESAQLRDAFVAAGVQGPWFAQNVCVFRTIDATATR